MCRGNGASCRILMKIGGEKDYFTEVQYICIRWFPLILSKIFSLARVA